MATDERNNDGTGKVAVGDDVGRRSRKKDDVGDELGPVIISVTGPELPPSPPKPAVGEVWVSLIESSPWTGRQQPSPVAAPAPEPDSSPRASFAGLADQNIWRTRDDVLRQATAEPVSNPKAVGPAVAELAVEEVEPPVLAEVPVPEALVVEDADRAAEVEVLAVENPAVEVPTVEATVVEATVVEATVVEATVVETTVVETTVVEGPPIEAPSVEGPPIEAPSVEVPADQILVSEVPAPSEAVAEPEPLPAQEPESELEPIAGAEEEISSTPNFGRLLADSEAISMLAAAAPPPGDATVEPAAEPACASGKVCASPCGQPRAVAEVPVEDLLSGVVSLAVTGIGGVVHGVGDVGSMLFLGIGRGRRAIRDGIHKVTGF